MARISGIKDEVHSEVTIEVNKTEVISSKFPGVVGEVTTEHSVTHNPKKSIIRIISFSEMTSKTLIGMITGFIGSGKKVGVGTKMKTGGATMSGTETEETGEEVMTIVSAYLIQDQIFLREVSRIGMDQTDKKSQNEVEAFCEIAVLQEDLCHVIIFPLRATRHQTQA